MSETADKKFYTLAQLAERWSVNVKWLRRQIYEGNIKAVKLGKLVRVSIEEVATYEASRPAA